MPHLFSVASYRAQKNIKFEKMQLNSCQIIAKPIFEFLGTMTPFKSFNVSFFTKRNIFNLLPYLAIFADLNKPGLGLNMPKNEWGSNQHT